MTHHYPAQPLPITPFDSYHPELAPALLEAIDAYDMEAVRVIVEIMAWIAGEETTLN